MRIGICTRYEQHESTYMAVRLAELFTDSMAADVSILTMSHNPGVVSKRWDRTLVQNRNVPFSKWASDRTSVLWTLIPHIEQIRWVRRQGKRTIVIVLWHEIETSEDMHALAFVDVVLCPTRACYDWLRAAGLGNCVYCGWDCGQPLHTKPAMYEIRQPSILVPLWDGNGRRREMTLVNLLDLLVQRHRDLRVTVACNSSTLASPASRKLSRNPRINIVRGTPPAARFLLFQRHDLTLHASHFESTGMTAIQSLEMGTPVAGFVFRPMNEILSTTNALMVPCVEEFNDIGFPRAIPDYDAMEEGLYYLLNDLEYLRQLQCTTLLGLTQRRETFSKAVKGVVV